MNVEGHAYVTLRRDCECPRVKHTHGTTIAYNSDGCRCGDCRDAHRIDRNTRRRLIAYGRWGNRFVPSVGTARRIQALNAAGWSLAEIGRQLGVTSTQVLILRDQRYPETRIDVAARVAAVYDAVWDQSPPAGTQYQRAAVTRIKAIAARSGWPPPAAWDDDEIDTPETPIYKSEPDSDAIDPVAVSEAVAGRRVTLTRPELTQAIETMTRMGMGAKEIAERVGTSSRRVVRTRSTDKPIRNWRKAAA